MTDKLTDRQRARLFASQTLLAIRLNDLSAAILAGISGAEPLERKRFDFDDAPPLEVKRVTITAPKNKGASKTKKRRRR